MAKFKFISITSVSSFNPPICMWYCEFMSILLAGFSGLAGSAIYERLTKNFGNIVGRMARARLERSGELGLKFKVLFSRKLKNNIY